MAMARYGDSSTGGGGSAVPAAPAAPTLPAGIGNDQQVNQANQFLRAQPWYQQWLQQNGQQPNNVHLTKDQAFSLLQMMRQKGVGISEAYSVDASGNIVKDGMPGWEKAAIVAGIVVAGVLVAPALVGALGASGAASTGAAAAAGDAAAASTVASVGGAAALGGVEAGATAGIGSAVASGALAGGAGAGLGAAGAAGATGATLAATTLPTATGTVAGGTGLTAAGLAGDGSVIGGAAGAGSTAAGVAAGGGIGDAVLRYGIPSATNIISSLIGANAAGNASDAQQKYLQEALDYEKSRDAAAIALEGSRYSNYSGNIAPYLATGASANARMASLLGLPAAPTGYGPGGPASSNTATPPLTYTPSATSTTAGATIGAPTAPVTTGAPLPRVGTTVTMRAPDGSTQAVPADQVDHWKSLGATVLSGAA